MENEPIKDVDADIQIAEKEKEEELEDLNGELEEIDRIYDEEMKYGEERMPEEFDEEVEQIGHVNDNSINL